MALTRPKYSSILDTDFKVSCKVATTGSSITLSGGAPDIVDGQNLAIGDRILVRDQSPASENGVYVVSTVGTGSNGTWVRAKDFASSTNVTSGIMIPVTQGNTRGGRIYLLTTPDPITLNSTNLTFTDITFSPEYSASITNSTAATSTTTGALTVTGGVGIGGNIYVGGNANITGDANVTGKVLASNLTVDNITIDGDTISSVHTTITIDPSTAGTGGTVVIAGNLQVTGTTTTINSTTTTIDDINILIANNAPNATAADGAGITIGGANATLTYVDSSNSWSFDRGLVVNGTANITGNANLGNLGTNVAVITTGNITTINSGLMQNGNSNIGIEANGNVTISVAGGANVITVFGGTGSGSQTLLDSELRVSTIAAIGPNINPNDFFGFADALVVGDPGSNSGITILTQSNGEGSIYFADGNTGSARAEGYIYYDHTANTMTLGVATNVSVLVLKNDSANITGNLNISSNLNVTGVSNLNSISNVKITGGSNGQFIQTDGVGNLSFVTLSPSSIFNGNSNVSVAANSNVTVSVAGNANVVTVTGIGANIAGTLDVTGNANVGNLGAGQLVPTTIYANGTVGSAGQFLSSTGTGLDWVTLSANSISNGNSNVVVSANSNVTISAVGNANVFTVTGTGANVAGTLDVTGNVTVANITANATVNLGNIANVKILGGTNNQYIKTDGTGNLSFSSSAGGGITFTASATAPVGPSPGDQWYDTANDIFYTYIDDSVSTYWFDLSSVPPYPQFTSSTTAPGTPTDGDYWYDTDAGVLYFRINDGTSSLWLDISSAPRVPISTASSTAPTTPTPEPGDFWWDTVDEVLYVRAGAPGSDFWLDISSQPNTFAAITTVNANVTGNLIVTGPTVSQSIIPSANATYTLGNSTNRYSNIWGLASSAQYADLAERYLADKPYDPGTVVVFGGSAEITVTVRDHDHRIAGVVSTDPAYLMNDSADKGNLWLPIALQGRVPTQVMGPVRKGDLLVSSSEPGVARRMSKALYEPGCVIGKSLEDHDEETVKVIEVVVGRI